MKSSLEQLNFFMHQRPLAAYAGAISNSRLAMAVLGFTTACSQHLRTFELFFFSLLTA